MSRAFDTVLASSDLSLDRVLNAGLPVAMVFYEREMPPDLRQEMDNIARQYAGKVLMVMLARDDAAQAASRFGVRRLPSLVTTREGKTVAIQEAVQPGDLKPHIAQLLGEGPPPVPRTAAQPSPTQKQAVMNSPIAVNEAAFEREVLRADRPVLVDFWAPWCGPCRMVAPALESLAREHGDALKVVKVNVDENPGLAGKYRAMSIPTMIVVKDGLEVDRWVGALPENAIRSRVARWIQAERRTA
ncbi:MAG TPA: thioredoxin [Anaerolineales bacterium]|nr:thioredoxin [Anaerolineales bacterium]